MTETAFSNIGSGLIKEAQAKKKSPRHIISELFPFIFEASSTMSAREISDWLKKEHNVTISFVAIAKALREGHRHWESFASEIEGYAGIVADAIGKNQQTFLFNERGFDQEVHEHAFMCRDASGMDQSESDYAKAVLFLKAKWFVLSPATRRECTPFLNRLWEFREDNRDAAFAAPSSPSAEHVEEGDE